MASLPAPKRLSVSFTSLPKPSGRASRATNLPRAPGSLSQPLDTEMAPGTLPGLSDRPLSAIGKIKSEKALKKALSSMDDGDAAAAAGGEAYLRGVKGQLEDMDRLAKLDWVQELLSEEGMETLLTCGAMSKPPGDVNGIDPDHLFMTLLRADLLRDLLFLYNPLKQQLHTCMSVGMDVCGHPSIVHGGFTSAMIDETTGGLVYELKKAGKLGPGSAFTVRLEVDYKRPMPASADVVCSARVESVEGRKVWVYAEVADRPGGTVYASGRALYVTPKQAAAADGH